PPPGAKPFPPAPPPPTRGRGTVPIGFGAPEPPAPAAPLPPGQTAPNFGELDLMVDLPSPVGARGEEDLEISELPALAGPRGGEWGERHLPMAVDNLPTTASAKPIRKRTEAFGEVDVDPIPPPPPKRRAPTVPMAQPGGAGPRSTMPMTQARKPVRRTVQFG